MSKGPLAGVKVVGLEQAVAGPMCTRHLADLGAEVVKVERVDGGDFARHYDNSLCGSSAHFAWLNWGKKSIAVDLKSPDGISILQRLLERADVLVSNLGPGALDRIIPRADRRRHGRLVECEITAFGSDGRNADRKGYDLLVLAEAGVVRATGTEDAPAKPGVSLADLSAGLYAATSVLAALVDRAESGVGTALSISMFDCVSEWMSPLLVAAKATGAAPRPVGLRHASITPYGHFATGDGSVMVAVQNQGQWQRLCGSVLNRPELGDDPRFRTNDLRCQNRILVERVVADRLAQLTSLEAETLLDQCDVPWARMNTPEQVVGHTELVERERWQRARLSNGARGDVLKSALPASVGDGVARVPSLGEDTRGVLLELGLTPDEVDRLQDHGVIKGST